VRENSLPYGLHACLKGERAMLATFAFEAGKADGSTVRFKLKLSFGMFLLSRMFGI
jgi:hypothetical protein